MEIQEQEQATTEQEQTNKKVPVTVSKLSNFNIISRFPVNADLTVIDKFNKIRNVNITNKDELVKKAKEIYEEYLNLILQLKNYETVVNSLVLNPSDFMYFNNLHGYLWLKNMQENEDSVVLELRLSNKSMHIKTSYTHYLTRIPNDCLSYLKSVYPNSIAFDDIDTMISLYTTAPLSHTDIYLKFSKKKQEVPNQSDNVIKLTNSTNMVKLFENNKLQTLVWYYWIKSGEAAKIEQNRTTTEKEPILAIPVYNHLYLSENTYNIEPNNIFVKELPISQYFQESDLLKLSKDVEVSQLFNKEWTLVDNNVYSLLFSPTREAVELICDKYISTISQSDKQSVLLMLRDLRSKERAAYDIHPIISYLILPKYLLKVCAEDLTKIAAKLSENTDDYVSVADSEGYLAYEPYYMRHRFLYTYNNYTRLYIMSENEEKENEVVEKVIPLNKFAEMLVNDIDYLYNSCYDIPVHRINVDYAYAHPHVSRNEYDNLYGIACNGSYTWPKILYKSLSDPEMQNKKTFAQGMRQFFDWVTEYNISDAYGKVNVPEIYFNNSATIGETAKCLLGIMTNFVKDNNVENGILPVKSLAETQKLVHNLRLSIKQVIDKHFNTKTFLYPVYTMLKLYETTCNSIPYLHKLYRIDAVKNEYNDRITKEINYTLENGGDINDIITNLDSISFINLNDICLSTYKSLVDLGVIIAHTAVAWLLNVTLTTLNRANVSALMPDDEELSNNSRIDVLKNIVHSDNLESENKHYKELMKKYANMKLSKEQAKKVESDLQTFIDKFVFVNSNPLTYMNYDIYMLNTLLISDSINTMYRYLSLFTTKLPDLSDVASKYKYIIPGMINPTSNSKLTESSILLDCSRFVSESQITLKEETKLLSNFSGRALNLLPEATRENYMIEFGVYSEIIKRITWWYEHLLETKSPYLV